MKRRDNQEEGSNSIFKIFERKKPKQVVGEEVAPKTIRHLERPVKLFSLSLLSILNTMNLITGSLSTVQLPL